ncbi:MAG: chemotaxis protein CheB [Treponemataceae bacterium]|nr:chemotaxis protein CheB [Spirochaetales bacterium]MDY6030477.1 chemotaxis protein CheB [Treponemataceae bacterium]
MTIFISVSGFMEKEKFVILVVSNSLEDRSSIVFDLEHTEKIKVISTQSDAKGAINFCCNNTVDAVLSAYDLPEMDGLESIKFLTGDLDIPVIIFSDDESLNSKSLSAGALAFVKKSSLNFAEEVLSHLSKIRENSFSQEDSSPNDSGDENKIVHENNFQILCIGASTGGPSAVRTILSRLGDNFPIPILYTQHIDSRLDTKFVELFNHDCPNTPMELAENGTVAQKGHVYMAPAKKHLVIDYISKEGNPVLKLSDEAPVNFLKPSINVMFKSASKFFKSKCLGVLLTGMGKDGAEGCKEIIDNEGYTIVEDKSTSVIYGMPGAAVKLNAAKSIIPRTQIAQKILELI